MISKLEFGEPLGLREFDDYPSMDVYLNCQASRGGFALSKDGQRRYHDVKGAKVGDPYRGTYYCKGRKKKCPFQVSFLNEASSTVYVATVCNTAIIML